MCSLSVMKVPDALSFLLVMYSCSEEEEKKKWNLRLLLAVDWGMSLPRETPCAARLLPVGSLVAISLLLKLTA